MKLKFSTSSIVFAITITASTTSTVKLRGHGGKNGNEVHQTSSRHLKASDVTESSNLFAEAKDTKASKAPKGGKSMEPSKVPSVGPMPSARPSLQPSAMPSALPTLEPSNAPSARPSLQPSAMPSALPTIEPSNAPSGRPSLQPSNVPSGLPTLQPSKAKVPSVGPTLSARPSLQPSAAKCSESGTSTFVFDDIVLPSEGYTGKPTTYRGFEWDNMGAIHRNIFPISGYFQGNISLENLVYSYEIGAMQSTTPFSVISLHVAPAWNQNMTLLIQAFRGSTPALVGTYAYEAKLGHPIIDYPLSDPSSSLISLETFSKNNPAQNFADINRLTLVATGGTNAGLGYSGAFLAVDNIVVCSDGMHAVMETYETYEQGEMVEQDFVGSNGRPSLDEEYNSV